MDKHDMNSNIEYVGNDTLSKIITLKNISKVVPVISNSFRIEHIFREEKKITEQIAKTSVYDDYDFSIDEQLTRNWANKIHYPLPDNHNLARVAQYHLVEHKGSDVAKEQYLEFLKSYLLDINANEAGYEETVKDLRRQINSRYFSDVVNELAYPRMSGSSDDSLALLAELPFPIYITTSYHDFLERALVKNNKSPRTQVIFWEEGVEYDNAENHYPDPTFIPSPQAPAVYHVFGLENYPGTLVLSEDDFMRFLISVVSTNDQHKPIVPPKLREAISSKHLLLMGFHLRDWEFRVLIQLILNYRKGQPLPKQGIFIQLKPKKEDQYLIKYLQHFFEQKQFEIEWKSSDDFIHDLWKVYKDQLP